VGALVGTGLLAVMLGARMWGKDEMEWKRRSWGLLENKGQVEVDNWSAVGSLGGAVAVVGMMGKGMGGKNLTAGLSGLGLRGLGWRGVVGAVGVGNVVGVIGYTGWRYGIKGGKWD